MTAVAAPVGGTCESVASDVGLDVEFLAVTKRFGEVVAVDEMDLAIRHGTFTSLLGPSGCGKTTTLRMVAGFEQPTDGEILLEGRPIQGVPPFRRNVNTVFQHYALFPHMSVAQNVGYGLRQRKVARAEEVRRVGEALELVRLAGYGDRRTWELSGGQQQRIALARALINKPLVLLLDEPLGALDLKLRKEMQLELKNLQREVGITFVYVTHDQEEALTMSDTIVVMKDGRIQQQGGPVELYERPVNRFVAGFIGESNRIDGRVVEVDHASRMAIVETDRGLRLRGLVTDRAARPARGDSATVVIRPERLEVLPESGESSDTASPSDGWVVARGRVAEGTYLGGQTEFRVETPATGTLTIRRQNALGAATGHSLGPGDPVLVRWREEASLVLFE
jgi:spermidine/putrescine transport system ATP-binding protein